MGGLLSILRFTVALSNRFNTLELKIVELSRQRDQKFAELALDIEQRLKLQRHEIYTTVQTQMAGPIELELTSTGKDIRGDIRALADRVLVLSNQVAVLVALEERMREEWEHERDARARERNERRGKP